MFSVRLVSIIGSAVVAVCLSPARAQALPDPSPASSFYILTIWDGLSRETTTDADVRREMDKYITQVGRGNKYHRGGFAFIWPGTDIFRARIKIAKEKGLALGVIIGGQTHSNPPFSDAMLKDLRNFQWRRDGVTWESYTVGGALSGDSRDLRVPSPSRYAKLARDYVHGIAVGSARDILPFLSEYPNTIGVVNAAIEEELATGGVHDEKWMSDYSPFAIAEFRDWLRHTGMYDPDTGKYAGQGAQAAITGAYITIGAKSASPFHDDPGPGNANGTGKSFNATFGTAFTTWTLKSWDPAAFPDPITDRNFNPSPPSGKGFTAGGFDAPRVRNDGAWWQAWSWDYEDRGMQQPPGNPGNPAFGFRQTMVRNYLMDYLDDLAAQGIPRGMLFAHQIPGELNPTRNRSGATPVWSGYNPHTGNLGITRFGEMDPNLVTQYSSNWGIFEWHPNPFLQAQDANLYPTAMRQLQQYYDNQARFLFPGWWFMPGEGDPNKIHGAPFPMQDSRFAAAIKDFLAARPETPFNYTPVANVPRDPAAPASRSRGRYASPSLLRKLDRDVLGRSFLYFGPKETGRCNGCMSR